VRITGRILKMKSQLAMQLIYYLPMEDKLIPMNELIGKTISLKYENEIYCISCGTLTKRSFAQGFCYKCFISSAETSECILRPELCRAQEGKGRDMEWEKKHHLQEHFVYLALSSDLKVGVTRSTQVPTRWIDQGASSAICLAKTPNRFLSGCIEVALKKHLTDKTNWQKMLKNEVKQGMNLSEAKMKVKEFLPEELKQYYIKEDLMTEINYPVISFPKKVKSIDFEKQNILTGKLNGIKGQYLIFEDGSVLNIRKHSGYVVSIEY
jgi:hypothetical protein